MPVISISIPGTLLEKVDKYIAEHGYTSRSEFVREALREYIAFQSPELAFSNGRVYGVLIALTDHGSAPAVDEKVIETIHSYQPLVRSFYHQLLEEGWCLNIAVVEAPWSKVVEILKSLRRIRGVEKAWFVPIGPG